MITRGIALLVGLILIGCSSDSDRPGPASGGTSGSGGASGGTGGTAVDGGVQCLDDHTEQRIGTTFSCGGAYCIPGIGCIKECTGPKDCRPGFTCQQVGPTLWQCS